MARAHYELLDDGTFYAEIPGLQGVYANAETLEACREQLQEVLKDWIMLGFHLGHSLPVIDGINLNAVAQKLLLLPDRVTPSSASGQALSGSSTQR